MRCSGWRNHQRNDRRRSFKLPAGPLDNLNVSQLDGSRGERLAQASRLLQQARHEDAERELRAALLADPDDPASHALLALCLAAQQRQQEAMEMAWAAIALAPDWSFPRYALAQVFGSWGEHAQAESALREAIRLDSEEPTYLAALAETLLSREKLREALDVASRTLAVDEDNSDAANVRGLALLHLGRREEAARALEVALRHDPGNAETHTAQGWCLLHLNNRAGALRHFSSALLLDPKQEGARLGLLEGLKAENPVYALLLRFALWTTRLTRQQRWLLTIGGGVGARLLYATAESNPPTRRLVVPLLLAYGLFVVLSWIGEPLFNLLLRLNRTVRVVLNREETLASNLVGICLGSSLLLLVVGLLTATTVMSFVALPAAGLAVAVAVAFSLERPGQRRLMGIYAVALAALVIDGAVLGVLRGGADDLAFVPLGLALVGILIAMWVGGALSYREERGR
jgi:tetratricopeptide (TPR) repeat protein